jgi:hypothetical protein
MSLRFVKQDIGDNALSQYDEQSGSGEFSEKRGHSTSSLRFEDR